LGSWLFATFTEISFWVVFPLWLAGGVICGAIFGLRMALFFHEEAATLSIGDKNAFLSRLNRATSELGYDPATRSEDFFTCKPSIWGAWTAYREGWGPGIISVQLRDGQAVLAGPTACIKKLLRRLATD
jgi:hypothetical protein